MDNAVTIGMLYCFTCLAPVIATSEFGSTYALGDWSKNNKK